MRTKGIELNDFDIKQFHAEVKKTDNTLEEIKSMLNTILRNTDG